MDILIPKKTPFRDIKHFSFRSIASHFTVYFMRLVFLYPRKHSKISDEILQNGQTNCLSVFDHFEGLGLKGLTNSNISQNSYFNETLNDTHMEKLDSVQKFI